MYDLYMYLFGGSANSLLALSARFGARNSNRLMAFPHLCRPCGQLHRNDRIQLSYKYSQASERSLVKVHMQLHVASPMIHVIDYGSYEHNRNSPLRHNTEDLYLEPSLFLVGLYTCATVSTGLTPSPTQRAQGPGYSSNLLLPVTGEPTYLPGRTLWTL